MVDPTVAASRRPAAFPPLGPPGGEPLVPRRRLAGLASWGLLVGAAETAGVAALFLLGLALVSGGDLPAPAARLADPAAQATGLPPLVLLAAALLAATLARAAVSLEYERRLARLHRDAVLAAADRLFPGYFAMDYRRFTARNSADRAAQLTTELDRAALALVAWTRAAALALVLALLAALVVAVDWRAAALGGLAALLVGAAALPLLRWTGRLAAQRRPAQADLAVAVAEPLRAYRDLATSGLWPRFHGRARADHARTTRLQGSLAVLQSAVPHVLEAGVAAVVLAAIAGAAAFGAGAASVTPALVLLVAGAYRFLPTLQRLLHSASAYRLNLPSLEGTLAELDEVERHRRVPHAQRGEPLGEAVLALDGVRFAHAGQELLLRGVSLRVRPGERVGIVGPSGAGKSTLVDLLLGLLEPSAGSLRLGLGPGGRPLRVAYLAQQPAFAQGTVLDNLALADEASVDRAEARRLLDLVGLTDLPLDHPLGEGGHGLSGGQRQRLGLARALHRGPDLLVLDEPTAALDAAAEQGLVQALDRLGGLAMVVVTHRTAPLALCDRVFRLEDGALVPERGQGAGAARALAAAR